MGDLVVRIVTKELVAPDGHVPRAVCAEVGLAIDDSIDVVRRELATVSRRDPREVGHGHREYGRDRPVAARVEAMTAGAGNPELPRAEFDGPMVMPCRGIVDLRG